MGEIQALYADGVQEASSQRGSSAEADQSRIIPIKTLWGSKTPARLRVARQTPSSATYSGGNAPRSNRVLPAQRRVRIHAPQERIAWNLSVSSRASRHSSPTRVVGPVCGTARVRVHDKW
jgi:hypothetical protein